MVFQRKRERGRPVLDTFWLIMLYNSDKVSTKESEVLTERVAPVTDLWHCRTEMASMNFRKEQMKTLNSIRCELRVIPHTREGIEGLGDPYMDEVNLGGILERDKNG